MEERSVRVHQIRVVVDVRVGNCGVRSGVGCWVMMAGGAERFKGIGQCAGRDAGCGRRVPVVVLQQGGHRKGLGLFSALWWIRYGN